MNHYVILSEGPNAKAFSPEAHEGATVIGVNTAYFTYQKQTGAFPPMSACIVQDKPSGFEKAGKGAIFGLPESVRLIVGTNAEKWQRKLGARANTTYYNNSQLHRFRERAVMGGPCYGNLTAVAAIFEAIRAGATHVHVYGHDLGNEYSTPASIEAIRATAVKELNFCHAMLSKAGGGLFLHEGSYLWQVGGLECGKASAKQAEASQGEAPEEKPKRRRRSKKE